MLQWVQIIEINQETIEKNLKRKNSGINKRFSKNMDIFFCFFVLTGIKFLLLKINHSKIFFLTDYLLHVF